MAETEKGCSNCGSLEHAIIRLEIKCCKSSGGQINPKAHVCRKCGHCTLFIGISSNANASNEVKPEELARQIKHFEGGCN